MVLKCTNKKYMWQVKVSSSVLRYSVVSWYHRVSSGPQYRYRQKSVLRYYGSIEVLPDTISGICNNEQANVGTNCNTTALGHDYHFNCNMRTPSSTCSRKHNTKPKQRQPHQLESTDKTHGTGTKHRHRQSSCIIRVLTLFHTFPDENEHIEASLTSGCICGCPLSSARLIFVPEHLRWK